MLYELREEPNWYILPVALPLPLESQPLRFTSSVHVLPNLVKQVINSQIYFLSIAFHFTFVSYVEKYWKLKIRYYGNINFISCRSAARAWIIDIQNQNVLSILYSTIVVCYLQVKFYGVGWDKKYLYLVNEWRYTQWIGNLIYLIIFSIACILPSNSLSLAQLIC